MSSPLEQCRADLLEGLKAVYAADEALIQGNTAAAVIALEKAQAALAEARKLLP